MVKLFTLAGLFPNPYQEGFSASLASLTTTSSQYLTGWTIASPGYSSPHFSTEDSAYTVPTTGLYVVQSTINYHTTSAISISLGTNVLPSIMLQRTSPTSADLLKGYFPVFNTDIQLVIRLTLKTILGAGTITLSDVVALTSGDVIKLYYDSNGMSSSIEVNMVNVVWSMFRIA